MDSPSHPLLQFLVRMKPKSTKVFLQVAKNVQVTRGKIWAVRRLLKCFPVKSLTRLAVWGQGFHGKGWFRPTTFQGVFFLLYGASQHPQPPRNEPHLSALLCLPPFSMLDEHPLNYAHLQSNKETTVWTCAFSLWMSPTLQMAVSIRNSVASFCEECVYDGC